MQTLWQIVLLLLTAFFTWKTYKALKGNPELFSKQNISKSLSTLGFLGLALIVLVAFMVMMVR